ncbi:hypothetical protein ZIOFF_029608 [Zingiber officinale]|uniref:Uncharacterized protein n=1 Tax=Zingiber officinale TaxID=94328 RepID=A0A8J5L4B5_ZINOF|nr:hypothetical protein ZIOFF_029608 [Zingiber officinale]
MNKLEATLEELVNMLANYEVTIKKEKSVFLAGSSSRSKKGIKKKGKKRYAPMKKIKPNKKPRPTKPNYTNYCRPLFQLFVLPFLRRRRLLFLPKELLHLLQHPASRLRREREEGPYATANIPEKAAPNAMALERERGEGHDNNAAGDSVHGHPDGTPNARRCRGKISELYTHTMGLVPMEKNAT